MGDYRYGTQLIPMSKSVGDKVPIPTSARYGLGTDRRRPVLVPSAEYTEWIPVGKIPTDYHPCQQPSPNVPHHLQTSPTIANGTPTWLFLTVHSLPKCRTP